MGYTHDYYPSANMDKTKWRELCKFVKTLIDNVDVKLVNGIGKKGTKPTVNDEKISFNGEGDDAHETLYIEYNNGGFHFCKTARKPYDKAVVAVLTFAEELGLFSQPWSPGGDEEDLKDGKELCDKIKKIMQ